MKRIRVVVLGCMIFISGTVLVALWVNQQRREGPGREAPKAVSDSAKMRLEQIHFMEDKAGRKTWELEARSIHQYENQDLLTLEDVKVTVFTKDGRFYTITGREGKVNQRTKDAELSGDVVLTSSEGYCMRTHSVSYRHDEKKVFTADPVEIEGEALRITGRGMLVDMQTRVFKILTRVRTRWRGGGRG